MLFQSLFIICLQFLACALAAPPQVTDPAHKLTYIGVLSAGVESFLNIRYGQDTGGANRFKHPKAYTYSSGTTVQATALGPACPQKTEQSLFGFSSNGGVTSLSEDCLSLRVDRVLGTQANSKHPVLVWIYGGGDESGSIDDSLYDPTALLLGAALKGTPLIFVAMNYRVNIFGFANSAALRSEGSLNNGLLDQRLALQWINQNIHLFGGDNSSITIFGQSDGGTGAGLHVTAYGGKGPALFQRAIMESGTPMGDPGVSSNLTINSTTAVAQIAGCTGTNNQLTCLRSLSTAALLTAVMKYENETANLTSQDIFFPVVDGSLIPAAPSQLLATGKFHKKISAIIGWNHDDGSIFTLPTFTTDTQVTEFIEADYPGLNQSSISTLLSLYPTNSFAAVAQTYSTPTMPISPQFYRAAQIYRDLNFACPALYTAYQISLQGSETYLYELNQSAFHNLQNLAGAAFEGVFHVSEIPYVFNDPGAYLGGPSDLVLASEVSGSWASFATKGNPVGNATLQGWTQAFKKADLSSKSGTVSAAEVRVIGGVNNAMTRFDSAGPEMLIKRCAFINTLYGQLQT